MKWNEMKWNEMKWNEMKWNNMKWNEMKWNETKSEIFPWDIFKSYTIYFFNEKILKYFNDFQNQIFSVSWGYLTQTIEMKQNQTFFYETYSNLTSHLFLAKSTKLFQWLSKSKCFSFMAKVNSTNENNFLFSLDIFKPGIIFHWSKNTKIFQWLL